MFSQYFIYFIQRNKKKHFHYLIFTIVRMGANVNRFKNVHSKGIHKFVCTLSSSLVHVVETIQNTLNGSILN